MSDRQLVVIVGECNDYEDRTFWIVCALPASELADSQASKWCKRANQISEQLSRTSSPMRRWLHLRLMTGDDSIPERVQFFSGIPHYHAVTPRTSLPVPNESH